jgi:SAM-dependent methyltransferase
MIDTDNVATVPYDQFFGLCTKAFKRHGNIFSLPVAVQPLKYLKFTYDSHYRGCRVLDVGCGVSKLLQKALGIGDELYHSCDNDPSCVFTYRSVNEISLEATYEIIAANQVFEHLNFEEGIKSAIKLARHVAPGGIFQIGVPNPQHPTRHLSNPTHKTPWNYLNLCALLELGGLEPFYCARCNKVPGPRWYERPLINMLCRVFRMDWCDTVYAVGKRVAESG